MGTLFPPLTEMLRRYVQALRDAVPDVERIVLFGSYARGQARPYSDVDLTVVAASFGGQDLLTRAVRLGHANERLMMPIEAIGVTPAEVANARPGSFLHEVLSSGVAVPLDAPESVAIVAK